MLIQVAGWRSDILKEHAEELEALWNRRLKAPRSPLRDLLALRRLDRRIVAHSDALVLAEEHATRFVERLFEAGEPESGAAAAFVVGHGDGQAQVQRLIEGLSAADSEVRLGMFAALELRAGPRVRDALATLASDSELKAGALAVLAAHDDPRAATMQPEGLLAEASPVARWLAWRAVRRLGPSARAESSHFDRGRAEANIQVKRAALEAAVATEQPWVRAELERVAATPDVARMVEHLLFAILAGDAAFPQVLALGAAPVLGYQRHQVLSACGRAPAVEALLAVMRAGDPVDAALAGVAFYRITGVSVAGAERVPIVPPGREPDDFSELVHVCDVARAERAWGGLRGAMGGSRWAYGVDTDATPQESLPDRLDLESRWAAALRAASSDRRLRFVEERLWDTTVIPASTLLPGARRGPA